MGELGRGVSLGKPHGDNIKSKRVCGYTKRDDKTFDAGWRRGWEWGWGWANGRGLGFCGKTLNSTCLRLFFSAWAFVRTEGIFCSLQSGVIPKKYMYVYMYFIIIDQI